MEQQTPKSGRFKESTWLGIFFLLIGGAWLIHLAGYPLPHWLFTWEMILILVGVFVGIKNGFRDFSWLIFILIGGVFLSDNIWPGLSFKKFMWPTIFIILGLMFVFAPKGPCRRRHRFHERMRRKFEFHERMRAEYAAGQHTSQVAAEPGTDITGEARDFDNTLETNLDIVSIFGGVKKKVLSKQFVGGEIVCVFGGAQIDLANADFNSPIVLDLVHIFGGAKLVVPANWEVRSEIAAIFGGVDDKRPRPATAAAPEKTLVLKGTIIFGGVEINTF